MGVSHVIQPVKNVFHIINTHLKLGYSQCSFPLGPWPFKHARYDELSLKLALSSHPTYGTLKKRERNMTHSQAPSLPSFPSEYYSKDFLN